MTDEPNPYAPPEPEAADVTPGLPETATPGVFVPGGRHVPAGHGIGWLRTGFALYKPSWGTWLGVAILLIIGIFALQWLPYGSLLPAVLQPVITAGLMLGIAAPETGGRLQVGDLFAALKQRGSRVLGLMALGAAWSGLSFVGMSFTGMADWYAHPDFARMPPNAWVFLVLNTVVGIPYWMATLFAPVLVGPGNLGTLEALKQSFSGALRNIPALIVYYLALSFGSSLFVVITCGLGTFVLVAVLYTSVYAAYRDVFFAPTDAAPRKRKKKRETTAET